jgi:glycerophosphoryl diester phosphodiesterase
MIEIDVHLTKDERVVVIHDETLERTTNGEGEIKHLNYDDIKNLDSGSWFSNEYKDENIPLLSEVIDLVDGRKKLLVEIKSDPKDKSPIATKVVEELIKYDALDWSVIQSFNDHILFEIHEKYPQVKLHKLIVFKFRMLPYALSDKVVKFSVEKYDFVDAINPHFRFVNRHFLKKLHDAGFKVNVWGAKNPNSYDKIKHLPIDGWITDHP